MKNVGSLRFVSSMGQKFTAMKNGLRRVRGRRNGRKQREKQRHLIAHNREFNGKFGYSNNYVKTSKYTLISFLPINLFEQFKRLANFYFLCLAIIQSCPVISSLQAYTTILPLSFVLAVSAIKDAYDDVQRHKSDWKVNNRVSATVRDGRIVQEKWQHVQVGDVIRMENGSFVAADILLLSTSEPDGLCYIETAELDGETNLKARQALAETAAMEDDLEALGSFDGEIYLGPPCSLLPPVPQAFQGRLEWRGRNYPLDNEKMLLRGCVIRNTKWCYGVVVFAGRDTKLMMNSGKTHFKRTSLDGFINVLIIGIMVFLVCMCLICSLLCGTWEFVYGPTFVNYMPITKLSTNHSGSIILTSLLVFLSYIVLLNTAVPISLYVSVEIIRLFHSLLINWDGQMYCEQSCTAAMARTTTLNEELGQIQYVFTDKTGTLTRNVMTFLKCSINGRVYGEVVDDMGYAIDPEALDRFDLKSRNRWADEKCKWYDPDLWLATQTDPSVEQFWLILALCHTVMPEWPDQDTLLYQAQSPDEAALVCAARNFGYIFKSRTSNTITVHVLGPGEDRIYELLSILEFDNIRKRMSVLVRRDGLCTLYSKGADSVILARLARSTSANVNMTQTHLDEFASDGLRTLCLAYKTVPQEYCQHWLNRQRQANTALENRQDTLTALYEEMEQDMTLVGATAIEDKLQDGVPETIANINKANVKIWMLTGDKQETAVSIGKSSHLLTGQMQNVFEINSDEFDAVEGALQEARRKLRQYKIANQPKRILPPTGGPRMTSRPSLSGSIFYDVGEDGTGEGNALVIDGRSLAQALDKRLELLFMKVARQCQTVICCRVTPSQKAEVVELVKKMENAVTLAIGDGANDVPMIKMAHIGVGISGQEGTQAVLASDFSIAQFRFLQRLLLVHGRWSYFRMSKFMRYFFYKNFAFTLVQFWFAFFSGYSAQTLYDAFFVSMYNTIFTSLPVLAVGVLDQDVDDKLSMQSPSLYTPGPSNRLFNMMSFGKSLLHGVFTSLALFFITYWASVESVNADGRSLGDLDTFGFTVVSGLVLSVTGQIALDTDHWTYLNVLAIFLSLAAFFLFTIVYYELLPRMKLFLQSGYGSCLAAITTSTYWFTGILICAVTLLPMVSLRYLYRTMKPSLTDRVRSKGRLESNADIPATPSMHPTQVVTLRADTDRSVSCSVAASPWPSYKTHRHQPSALSMPARTPSMWQTRGGRMRTVSIRSGYAFSHEYGFGEMITSGMLRMRSERPDRRESGSITDAPIRRNFKYDADCDND